MDSIEVSKTERTGIETARDTYLYWLEKSARTTGFGRIADDVDKLIQYGEEVALEGRVTSENLLAEYRA